MVLKDIAQVNGAVDGSGVCSLMDDSSRAGSKIGRLLLLANSNVAPEFELDK